MITNNVNFKYVIENFGVQYTHFESFVMVGNWFEV